MAAPQASSPNPLPPEATGSPPSKQSLLFKVLSAMFTGGLLVLIVLWLLPQLTEYADVGAALAAMRPSQLLALAVGGLSILILNGVAMAAPLHGIGPGRAFIAQQSCTAVSNVIPGPSGTAARFAILHSWKVSVEDFTRATFAVSVWSNVTMISMPGIAFIIIAITQGVTYDGKNLLGLAAVAIIASVIAIGAAIGALRSERFVRWLGRATQWLYNPCRRLFRKPPVTDLEAQAVELRNRTVDVLHDRGGRLTVVTVGNYWLNGLVLTLCMWFCGIPTSELSLIIGLALYSIGRLSTIIQITPGGIGVVEVAYTAVFAALLGDQWHAQIVAAVLIYRLLTYLAPIIIGGGCYVLWRRGLARQRRAEAAAATA
jgi:uncharacterized protein (TIRG00374 family)